MILVIVCRLTKMALFIATRATDTSEDLAQLYLRHVFSKHGTPSDIISDCSKTFMSDFWSSLCRLLHIKQNLSTAYHPETDSQTDRVAHGSGMGWRGPTRTRTRETHTRTGTGRKPYP